ncbi:MAG: class II glutamine amidotransferase [Proteobacteria bacterium]|nr:class II glutamine amidotransferase [Pseudomonadota bacterium]
MNMCFAFLCNDAGLSATAQAAFRDSLTIEGGAPQGWGWSYYQAGEPLLRKQPQGLRTEPLDLCSRMAHLRTHLVLGHVAGPSTDPRAMENTQPFRFNNWTFCHVGAIPHLDAILPALLRAIPDFMRRNIHGVSAGEVLFHLFLAFLSDAGRLDDDQLPAPQASAALNSALAYLDRLQRDHGGPVRELCCLATNGKVVLATRRGLPLALARKSGFPNVGHDVDGRSLSYPHLKSVLIVAGRELAGAGWEAVDDHALICVDPTLNIEQCAGKLDASAEG